VRNACVDVLMKLIQLMTLSRLVYKILFNDSRAKYNLPNFIDQTQFSKTETVIYTKANKVSN